jgi:hypothetical protein
MYFLFTLEKINFMNNNNYHAIKCFDSKKYISVYFGAGLNSCSILKAIKIVAGVVYKNRITKNPIQF